MASLMEAQSRTQSVSDEAARVFSGEWSLRRLRDMIDQKQRVFASDLWPRLLELGWDRVLLADSGTGIPELCVLVEAMGRALAPVPLAQAAIAAGMLDAPAAESTALTIPAIRDHRVAPGSSGHGIVAARAGDGFRLQGSVGFLPWGDQADTFIVAAGVEGGEGSGLFRVSAGSAGVKRVALAALDWWPLGELVLEGVEVPEADVIAPGGAHNRLLSVASDRHALADCAELVGVVSGALELAVQYAQVRVAFDKPIGSFQAVKHKLVDLRADVEVARALVMSAAQSMDADSAGASVAVARAAFWCVERLRRVPEGALQVFGGIGFTWEHDMHLFLRRAATLVALLGDRAVYRERIVNELAA